VLADGRDIGLAFDGDADRVFLVDEAGRGVSGSLTTALLAQGILAKNPGETVLHNLICSKAVPEVIRESGGTPVRTKVGHSFIKAVMAETGAVFGGEHSAHYYFRDNYRADSGLIAAMIVLEQLSVSGRRLSELIAPLDRYAASGEINSVVEDRDAALARVTAAYPDATIDDTDGRTFDLGSWWFNLRRSNTEPLLRLNLEAPTGRAATLGRARSSPSCASPTPAGPRPACPTPAPRRHDPWPSTHGSSRSWPVRRTRARCSTSPTRTRCTTRACSGATTSATTSR
jgi:phosphomannomutase